MGVCVGAVCFVFKQNSLNINEVIHVSIGATRAL